MYPITFKKERAQYLLDCLLNGRPMLHDPDQPGWTVDEMLQLAGACFFAVAAHGPIQSLTAAQLQEWEQEHPEHREAEIGGPRKGPPGWAGPPGSTVRQSRMRVTAPHHGSGA